MYWYHPHVREDYGQELGLYGNILVVPDDVDYWAPVNRETLLTLDDILVEDGKVAPFSRSETTHTAMGRFGNILLVAGEPELALNVRLGEVVRFYLTNTANTRVFSVGLEQARMKLVGADSGRYEHEQRVERVLLAHLSAPWSMCFSTSQDRCGSSITRRSVPTYLPLSRSPRTAFRSRSQTSSRSCAKTRRWWLSANGSPPT